MGARSCSSGQYRYVWFPAGDCAGPKTRPKQHRDLARHRGVAPPTAPSPAATGCAPGQRQERAQGLCLSDRADADGGLRNGRRQGAGQHQCGRRRANRAHRFAEYRGCPAAAGAGHHHQRRDRQSISAGHPISRLRCVPRRRHAAGACGLPERRAHQRSLRRHRQLGPDPDRCDQVGHRRDQQSRVRPERAGRRGQRADEERLQLSGRRNQHDGRLVRAHPEFGAVGQAGRQICRLRRARRRA